MNWTESRNLRSKCRFIVRTLISNISYTQNMFRLTFIFSDSTLGFRWWRGFCCSAWRTLDWVNSIQFEVQPQQQRAAQTFWTKSGRQWRIPPGSGQPGIPSLTAHDIPEPKWLSSAVTLSSGFPRLIDPGSAAADRSALELNESPSRPIFLTYNFVID